MKSYRLADDLTVSRIGYGCMHLSRAWDATPVTAEEPALLLFRTTLPGVA